MGRQRVHVFPFPGPESEPECTAESGIDWSAFERTTLYARFARAPLLYVLALFAAVPALVIALPIAVVNAGVHGSPARILFRQERVGRRGKTFHILKFRTMSGEPGDGPDVHRVTRFGRFLRNSHLDELPQLLNVLRGDMALIGPRPEVVSIERWAAGRVTGFSERLVLQPGLTGWAQIRQGYAADGDRDAYARKLELNRDYLASLSFGKDLEILFRTATWMLALRGWRPRVSSPRAISVRDQEP